MSHVLAAVSPTTTADCPGLAPWIRVFSTCPSSAVTPDNYLRRVTEVAKWSEAAGCAGILVYTDNSLIDPWMVSQVIIENTRSLAPLVAVQPVYMHPYTVAKMISSFAFLYERRVVLNMVAGGFKNDLLALNDGTPHEARYDRLVEYASIIRRLLQDRAPLTWEGRFYKVVNLSLTPPLPPELFPDIFVSGSSEAGLVAAQAIGATAVKYPEPPDQCAAGAFASAASDSEMFGVRVGIIAREHDDQAWSIALERFPPDRAGQLKHQVAMSVSDSVWHKRLSEIGRSRNGKRDTYWLAPFENYKTFCPYLVGSYESVAFELSRYLSAGYRTYILDIPASEEEFRHIANVFRLASKRVAS